MLLVRSCSTRSSIFSLFAFPVLLVVTLDLCQLAPSASAALLNCSAFAPPPVASAALSNKERWKWKSNATGTPKRYYEARLHRCFQANLYDTSQLPVDEDSSVTPFKIGYRFAVDRLQAETIRADVIATGSLYLLWTDAYRSWNLSEIPVDSLVVPVSEIWTPALRVVRPNSADIDILFDPQTRARIFHNGSVSVALRGQFTTFCEGNLRTFPFDTQKCSILLALSHQKVSDFTISNSSDSYNTSVSEIKSDKFGVLEMWDYPHEFNIREEGSLPGFVLSILMKRNPFFHIFNIFIPVFLLTAVNVFTMFPEPVDRLNVATMIIIGFPVIQGRAEIIIPEFDESPPIAGYIAASYMLASLNLLFCSILCYYEKQPNAALSRFFSSRFCLPVHCGQTRSIRVLKELNEERRAVATRRERLRELVGRQTNPSTNLNVGGSASSSRTNSENSSGSEDAHHSTLDSAQHTAAGNELSKIENGLSMHPIFSSSTQAILSMSNLNDHTAITVVDDKKLDVPDDDELAALRHRYSFLALKFVLGMIHFGMTIVLIVQYEVWPMIMMAMNEMPIFGWSLFLFSIGSAVLYVFECTLWPWYRDLSHRHWHFDEHWRTFSDHCRTLFLRIRYYRQRSTSNTDL